MKDPLELQKKQMHEAAILYYEKNHTQSQIARMMDLSRQTVSKLLNDALKEGIVEINIRSPEVTCADLETAICSRFGLQQAVVCPASASDEALRQLMTVKAAANYIAPLAQKGSQNIAISWGRTIQSLIGEFGKLSTPTNTIFPLFGATDQEQAYYSPNELARNFADKLGARVKYAWFPYRPDSPEDSRLFKNTTYYQTLNQLWENIDIAILGIGSSTVIQAFGKIFGYNEKCLAAIGDLATHFFDSDGNFLDLYENTLCASKENIKAARQTIAIACGDEKVAAIAGSLRTGLIDTLITDEHTARKILDNE